MSTNTLASMGAQQKIFYDRTLLSRLLPNLVFLKYGQKKPIPRREGATANFRRLNRLPPATTPLVEGVTPTGQTLSWATVNATVLGYGSFVTLTDLVDMSAIDPVATETIEALGEQAAETLDMVVRDVLVAGTNVFRVGGHLNRNQIVAANTYTAATGRRVRQIMARNNVKPVVGKKYLAFIHPDAAHDVTADPAWIEAKQYADPQALIAGEIGELNGVRYIETTLAPIFENAGAAGTVDVYATIVIGRDAYGVPDIAGSSKPQTFVKPLGSAGADDPMNQRSSCAWKAYLATVRLDELCILRVEHSSSIAAN